MPNSAVFGVLDVGSNSVRLLVGRWAQGRPVRLHAEKITTRLLSGMAGGLLSPDSIRRTAQAIALLADRARAMGAVQVEGFGTSAMRDGGNRDVLIALARQAGVELKVLSGEEEAALAYAGAAPQGRRGVVDIGGGSTELLAGKDGAPLAAYSARMGAVRLAEALGGDLRPGPMLDRARQALAPAWAAVAPCPVEGWVGVGGTITSLAALDLALVPYDPDKVQGHPLTLQGVQAQFQRLCALDLAQRKALPGLDPARADIIPFGAAILLSFFQLSGADRLLASDQDNLLGYARRFLTPEP